ncbi:acetyl-CoA carboxylase biotin carboxyl carrier protein [Ammoniphilus sp. YIM 78166]|uniref:acetyl-CoA carboxylase biotin carboxyl carrier protein n=1 Tax=Ammoniphilus sp. YIM 78166 TaxID=1644106 RepID=UPI00106FE8D5|nr:acetyl-CoA carboxylase biotin carboxyl carrier protein [Ammoniphilus sp. YIM 78166]
MLKLHEIREIIKLLDQSSVQEFDLEHEGLRISVKKGGRVNQVAEVQVPVAPAVQPAPLPIQTAQAPVPVHPPAPQPPAPKLPTAQPAEENLLKIVSPMVGTFYSKPDPNSPVFVKEGDRVGANTIVCIVEAMKLFNEIEAEVTGEVVKVLATDGQLVEYGQPLFLVKP